jgi:hypothetical protein
VVVDVTVTVALVVTIGEFPPEASLESAAVLVSTLVSVLVIDDVSLSV